MAEVHITLDEAIERALQNVNEHNELPAKVYDEIASLLSEEEQKLFVSMLNGKGIRVIDLSMSDNLVTAVDVSEDVLESIKKRFMESVTDGQVDFSVIENIIEGIEDEILASRFLDWVLELNLDIVGFDIGAKSKKKKLEPNKLMRTTTPYREKVKKEIQKIISLEVKKDDVR